MSGLRLIDYYWDHACLQAAARSDHERMRSGEKLQTEYALKRHPFADSDGIDTLIILMGIGDTMGPRCIGERQMATLLIARWLSMHLPLYR